MNGPDEADRNNLVANIYACAVDPGRWNDTLRLIVERLDTPGWEVAMLVESRQMPAAGRFLGVTGLDDEARDFYLERFAGRNPWTNKIAPSPLGIVVDTDDLMARTDLVESAFYKDYLSRWNLQRAVAIVIDKQPGATLGFVMPGPGDANLDRLKWEMRQLAPHLGRSIAISQMLGHANIRLQAAETALDSAPDAVVMVTPSLAVACANRKAQELAAQNAFGLTGAFKFSDAKAQARLIAVANALPPASATFLAALPDGRTLPVRATRIPNQTATVIGGTMLGATVMVSIGISAQIPLIHPEELVAWFGLTPAEANLAAALAGGATLKDHAARRGVSINAARFLLKGIYRKTAVASQAQLVARVRSLPLH